MLKNLTTTTTTKNNLWCQLCICILRPHSSTLVDQLVLPVLFNEHYTMPHWMLKYRTLLNEDRDALYTTSCNLFNNQSCNICWSIKCWNVCHWFNSRSVPKRMDKWSVTQPSTLQRCPSMKKDFFLAGSVCSISIGG